MILGVHDDASDCNIFFRQPENRHDGYKNDNNLSVHVDANINCIYHNIGYVLMDFSIMATDKRSNGDISTCTSLLLLTLKLVSSSLYFFRF